jgi:hypothetical protein
MQKKNNHCFSAPEYKPASVDHILAKMFLTAALLETIKKTCGNPLANVYFIEA